MKLGKLKEFFDGDMDADDSPMNTMGDLDNDADMFVDDETVEVCGVAAEPTKITSTDGTTILVGTGDEFKIVAESKKRK